jgi:phage terminase large subunit-like protein
MRRLKKYKPTQFMAPDSNYSKDAADYAVAFIQALCHTKGSWAGKPFELIDWQEQIIRDIFGILKPNGYRQFNTAYVEIPKKMGKSELAAAIALLLTCGDNEERAEVYGCAADRQQASIVFEVAADMVRMCPALNKRVKILASTKRLICVSVTSVLIANSRCVISRSSSISFNVSPGWIINSRDKPFVLTAMIIHHPLYNHRFALFQNFRFNAFRVRPDNESDITCNRNPIITF